MDIIKERLKLITGENKMKLPDNYKSGYDEPKKDGLYECLVYIIDVPGHHKVNRKYTVKKGWDLMGLENVIAWREKE